MKTIISTDDPALIRQIASNSKPIQLFKKKEDGHTFKVGETRQLIGLVDFPEFNGQTVEIEAIREDGPNGRAYYIKGEINKFLNWTYEYRLR